MSYFTFIPRHLELTFFDSNPIKISLPMGDAMDALLTEMAQSMDAAPDLPRIYPVGYFLKVIPYVGMCGSPWGRSRLPDCPVYGRLSENHALPRFHGHGL